MHSVSNNICSRKTTVCLYIRTRGYDSLCTYITSGSLHDVGKQRHFKKIYFKTDARERILSHSRHAPTAERVLVLFSHWNVMLVIT